MIRERVVDGERIVTVDTEEELAQAIARPDVTVEAPPEIAEAQGSPLRSAARQPGAKEKEAAATGIPPQQSRSRFEAGREAALQNIASRDIASGAATPPARVLRRTGPPGR